MKTPKRHIGDTGEGVACKYLEGKGYTVLERNYLRPWGEIDIVARQGNKLHFVEVKSVTREPASLRGGGDVTRGTLSSSKGEAPYRPEDNVHPAKLKRLHRAIQTYLMDHKVPESIEWQLDVACVYLNFSTRKAHVEMLENVII